jgi:hypothetical protein
MLPLFWAIHFQTSISSSLWANAQPSRLHLFLFSMSQQILKFSPRVYVGGGGRSTFLDGKIRKVTLTSFHEWPCWHWLDLGFFLSLTLRCAQHVEHTFTTRGHFCTPEDGTELEKWLDCARPVSPVSSPVTLLFPVVSCSTFDAADCEERPELLLVPEIKLITSSGLWTANRTYAYFLRQRHVFSKVKFQTMRTSTKFSLNKTTRKHEHQR